MKSTNIIDINSEETKKNKLSRDKIYFKCIKCDGRGELGLSGVIKCDVCNETGKVTCDDGGGR